MTKPLFTEPEHPFHHRMAMQIRFTDIDMLGHLNNSIYLQFMDLAKVQYFTDLKNEHIAQGSELTQIDIVIANINASFLAQTHFGEKLEVLTQVESVGTKSMVVNQRVVNPETGELKCVGSTVMVALDLAAGHSVAITADWIDAFTAYEGHDVKAKK
jgi:acyl-CoA thioester hydrolase